MKDKNEVGKIIRNALNYADLEPIDLQKRKIMVRQTYYAKEKDPRRFTLDELWKIDKEVHFTDGEILAMFGRRSSRL